MTLGVRLRLVWRTIRLGATNVRAHKMRSILTVLGIIFGVCSVISMLSIGEGASREVQERIMKLGAQNIIIQSIKPPQSPEAQTSRNMVVEYGLTYDDAERLASTLPAVEVSMPIKSRTEDAWVGPRKVSVQMLATVPWYKANLLRGRFFSSLDMRRQDNVCVLSDRIARQLFVIDDPLGQPLKLGSQLYTIIGITGETQTVGAQKGSGPDDDLPSQAADCFVPITTFRARNGDLIVRRQQGSMSAEKVQLSELILALRRLDDVVPTARLVEATLKKYHPKQDYKVVVPQMLLEEARRTQRIFSIVLGSIAAISLLVGGIGIMNIMLATVSERTREIGVRRALGARQRDIMAQFLVETLILSVGGGFLGMALGAVIPWVVTRFSGLRTVLTPESFILSFAVSAVIGIIFGLYPARRAAMMNPIDALRHE